MDSSKNEWWIIPFKKFSRFRVKHGSIYQCSRPGSIIMLSMSRQIYTPFIITKKQQQEMFLKHVCPPKLNCHCDLNLWPRNPKFNRGCLLVMTNHYTKLEDPWLDKICLWTDWRTDVLTNQHVQTNIPCTSSRGGGIINIYTT